MRLTLDQLPLKLGLRDHAQFDSFVPAENAEAVNYLKNLPQTTVASAFCTYIWGASGSGKTHLLQAVCHEASHHDSAAVYLPMQTLSTFSTDILNGLETMALICIDDIHLIASHSAWEQALFRLFISIDQACSRLIISANAAPTNIGIELSDLRSRLNGGMMFRLKPVAEPSKLDALLLRARRRGLNLPESVARYLVRRFGENMTQLFATLDQLDQASLAAKRKVTIPFIRQVIDQR